MAGPIVHRIDPILPWVGSIGGVHVWWYGLSYAVGFVELYIYLRLSRRRLAMTGREVYALVLLFATGAIAGGRLVEVLFDEWPFYRQHPALVPALWLGGMATHGLLVGAAAGLTVFVYAYRKPFLEFADALVIPGLVLLGLGRIGNFIDGQIVGAVTDMPWGVQFPDASGVRHPVTLYDGAKNLLLIPYLMYVRRTNPTPGAVAARFVFWYAALRIPVNLFRDYPTHRLALGTGQTLNIVMAVIGAVLLVRSRLRRLGRLAPRPAPDFSAPAVDPPPRMAERAAFVLLLLVSLTMPSNWTQDVVARYSKRHPGLVRSAIYPALDTSPAPSARR